ncbi:MAG: multidrug efflux SMR transporter [Alphaproteobacteria bacterium]|nr:multidrug efflux SMR transporter [Alphaproteobacteria bacterium]
MAWIYLLIAGVCEVGWPLGLKLANKANFNTALGFILSGISIFLSGLFLFLAQRDIPMGTAYAIWTAIGASGTFILGILLFGDIASMARYFGIVLIILGVITLKLAE